MPTTPTPLDWILAHGIRKSIGDGASVERIVSALTGRGDGTKLGKLSPKAPNQARGLANAIVEYREKQTADAPASEPDAESAIPATMTDLVELIASAAGVTVAQICGDTVMSSSEKMRLESVFSKIVAAIGDEEEAE